jgi:hypothetical protein
MIVPINRVFTLIAVRKITKHAALLIRKHHDFTCNPKLENLHASQFVIDGAPFFGYSAKCQEIGTFMRSILGPMRINYSWRVVLKRLKEQKLKNMQQCSLT